MKLRARSCITYGTIFIQQLLFFLFLLSSTFILKAVILDGIGISANSILLVAAGEVSCCHTLH